MNNRNWSSYWAKQETPRHAFNNDVFYQDLSREISLHTGPLKGIKVLELGCGNGAIFAHLDIDADQYTGVDFSPSLLEQFRERNTSLNLIEQDALGFLRENKAKYDLIFSFGVLQYLNKAELGELFQLQAHALQPNGLCAHFGLPVRELSKPFYEGIGSSHALGNAQPRSYFKTVRSMVSNRIGHWHSIVDLHQQSEAAGYSTRVVSNIYYFYRINLLQSLQTLNNVSLKPSAS